MLTNQMTAVQSMRVPVPRSTLLAIAAAAMLAGCGERDAAESTDTGVGVAAADSIATVNSYRAGPLVIEDVVAPAPIPVGERGAPIAVYFRVRNTGTVADTLDRIEITGGTATLHQQTGAGEGMATMVPLTFAVLPPGERVAFVPGGRHVMIQGLSRPVTIGEVIPMTFVFRHAGPAPVAARVVAYGDLERVLSGAAAHPEH